ncbi:MAG: transcription elongation protein SprT [Flavobacteriales bacterium]|nr:transcription elongation protein SprT [Flavobacteriales bacterium]
MRFTPVGSSLDAIEYWRGLLLHHVPEGAVTYSAELLAESPIVLHISRPRKTKLGHFKRTTSRSIPEISINVDLGPERFLFTLIHEIAHWKAFDLYGRGIRPHGREWKSLFIELIRPLLQKEVFSPGIAAVIQEHLRSPKASSCSDPQLQRAFDQAEGIHRPHLDEVPYGEVFTLSNGRSFIKGPRKRTRYLCQEVKSGKRYLIPGAIHVLDHVESV